jgi:rubredoxin
MVTAADQQWVCPLCGHIYDEAVGDPAQSVPPGTRLQDLPEDWCCPDCSAASTDFELAP